MNGTIQPVPNPVATESMDRFRLLLLLFVGAILIATAPVGLGQIRKDSRLVVDVIQLKNQKQIRGFVLTGHANEDLAIAVSNAWFEKHDQTAFLKAEKIAQQQAIKARLQLRDRLQAVLNELTPIDAHGQLRNKAFDFYIKKEIDRVNAIIENPRDVEFQFLVLRIKPSAVSNFSLASDANRKIAVWSWYERLQDVESRTPNDLEKELATKKIDVASTPPELDDRFYSIEESEDQWAVRLSIVAHRLDRPIEFQGSGNVMLTASEGDLPDVASLMAKMMQSQMSSLIQDLTEGPKKAVNLKTEEEEWVKSAVAAAEKIKATYFRATHVRLDPLGNLARVESAFMVKLASGKWTMAWQTSSLQSSDQQKPDAIQKIESDPQVKAIRVPFEALGGGAADMTQTLRIGAATMTAQSIVNVEFQKYSERYLRQMSSPAIWQPPKQ